MVQAGVGKVQLVVLQGTNWVGGQISVNWLVETPVENIRLQEFDLLLIFSINVKVIGVEAQTGVPGAGF